MSTTCNHRKDLLAMEELCSLGRLRNEAGLTQEDLARRSGVSWITIAKLEGGDHIPNLDTLHKLATVLGEKVYTLQYGWRKQYKTRGRPKKGNEQETDEVTSAERRDLQIEL